MSFFYFAKFFCQEMRYLHEYIQNVKKNHNQIMKV